MNKELEKQLIDEFPSFFRDMYGDPRKTCMARGCDFGDGWYNLLHVLCKEIKKEADNDPSTDFHFSQIKEKFGLMRIYARGYNKKMISILDEYEQLSAFICEVCGNPEGCTTEGKMWIRTLCEKCRK